MDSEASFENAHRSGLCMDPKHELKATQEEIKVTGKWQRKAFDKVRKEIDKLGEEQAKEVKAAFNDACRSSWRMGCLSIKAMTLARREHSSKEDYREKLQSANKRIKVEEGQSQDVEDVHDVEDVEEEEDQTEDVEDVADVEAPDLYNAD